MWVRSLVLILSAATGLVAQLSVSAEVGLEVAPNFWSWHGAGSNSGGLEAKTGKVRFQSDPGAWGFLLMEARLRVPDPETEPELHDLYDALIAPENFPALGLDAGHSPPEVPGSHCIVSRFFLEQVGVLPFLPDSLGVDAARRYYQPILTTSANNPSPVPREWNVQAPVWLAQEIPGIGLGQGQAMADYWRPAAASSTDFTRLDFRLLWERALSCEIQDLTGPRNASAFFKNSTDLIPAQFGNMFSADATWHDCAAIVGLELNLQFVAFRAAEAAATPSELTTPGVAVSIGTVDMGLSAPLIVTMPSTGAAGLPLGIELYETTFQCRVGVKKTVFASGATGTDSTITFELPVPPSTLGLNQGNQLTTFVTVDAARAQWGRVSFTFPNLGYTGPARIVSTTNHFGSFATPITPGAWPITILP